MSRFKPGQSGNPSGRPKGKGRQVAKLREEIDQYVPQIIKSLINAALNGDVTAAKILIDRVIPPMKSVESMTPLSLPDGTLTDQGRSVLKAVAAAEIGPGQGAALIGAIGRLAAVAEFDEINKRLENIERQQNENRND